jgi:hypothetical protein
MHLFKRTSYMSEVAEKVSQLKVTVVSVPTKPRLFKVQE